LLHAKTFTDAAYHCGKALIVAAAGFSFGDDSYHRLG